MQAPRHAAALLIGSLTSCAGTLLLWSASGLGGAPSIGVVREYSAASIEEGAEAKASTEELAPAYPAAASAPRVRASQAPTPSGPTHTRPSQRVLRLADWKVNGLVVDIEGRPLSGQSIRVGADDPEVTRAVSDAAGAFEMAVTGRSDRLDASSPGRITVAATRASRGLQGLVVVAPALPCSASVRDSSTGLSLVAARVTPVASERLHTKLIEARGRLKRDVAGTIPPFVTSAFFAASTNAAGIAELPALPAAGWTDLVVSRPGFEDRRVSLEQAVNGVLVIELDPVVEAASWEGRVMDEAGRPVPGALIQVARASTRSSEDGSFAIPCAGGDTKCLDAFHPGRGLVRIALPDLHSAPIEVVLRPHVPPLGARLVLDKSVTSASLRVVPLNKEGGPALAAPPWRTAQVDAERNLRLPASMAGESLAVVDKDGSVHGHIVLGPGELLVR